MTNTLPFLRTAGSFDMFDNSNAALNLLHLDHCMSAKVPVALPSTRVFQKLGPDLHKRLRLPIVKRPSIACMVLAGVTGCLKRICKLMEKLWRVMKRKSALCCGKK